MFFRERDGQGDVIDFDAPVLGALQLPSALLKPTRKKAGR
jgi:hypothetical protein